MDEKREEKRVCCITLYMCVLPSSHPLPPTPSTSPLQEKVPLSWVNQPLFDYRNQLRSGAVTLPCWPVSPEEPLEDLLNPIGQC